MKLYKYYPDNINSFKSLSVRGLWCHYPSNMNDPFESLGFLEREISKEEINAIKRQFHQSNNPRIKKILRFTDKQFRKFINESRKMTIRQFAFCSLSETYDNILMWSHYASSHTGFVLEFEFDENFSTQIFKVEYKNHLPNFDYREILDLIEGNFDCFDSIFKDISIKSEDWNYEKEYRIWIKEPGYMSYPQESLKRIIFGVNCSNETKRLVMGIMSDFKRTVDLNELIMKKEPLKLVEKKISW